MTSKIRESLLERSRTMALVKTRAVLGICLFLILFIVVAMFLAPSQGMEFHFDNERGVITTLSAIFLATASAAAGISFFIRAESKDRQRFFWHWRQQHSSSSLSMSFSVSTKDSIRK